MPNIIYWYNNFRSDFKQIGYICKYNYNVNNHLSHSNRIRISSFKPRFYVHDYQIKKLSLSTVLNSFKDEQIKEINDIKEKVIKEKEWDHFILQQFSKYQYLSQSFVDQDAFNQKLWNHFLTIKHPSRIFSGTIDRERGNSDSTFRIEFLKALGPGGQHKNKTNSCVRITHLITGVQGEASEDRNQIKNRKEAWKRLLINLAIHVRSPVQDAIMIRYLFDNLKDEENIDINDKLELLQTKTKLLCNSDIIHNLDSNLKQKKLNINYEKQIVVQKNIDSNLYSIIYLEDDLPIYTLSNYWNERYSSGKIHVNPDSNAYPEIVSDLLDILYAFDGSLPNTKAYLESHHKIKLSSHQLLDILSKNKNVWASVNQMRQKQGLSIWKM